MAALSLQGACRWHDDGQALQFARCFPDQSAFLERRIVDATRPSSGSSSKPVTLGRSSRRHRPEASRRSPNMPCI